MRHTGPLKGSLYVYSFLLGVESAAKASSMKNPNDTIGNRTCDLPACSPVCMLTGGWPFISHISPRSISGIFLVNDIIFVYHHEKLFLQCLLKGCLFKVLRIADPTCVAYFGTAFRQGRAQCFRIHVTRSTGNSINPLRLSCQLLPARFWWAQGFKIPWQFQERERLALYNNDYFMT